MAQIGPIFPSFSQGMQGQKAEEDSFAQALLQSSIQVALVDDAFLRAMGRVLGSSRSKLVPCKKDSYAMLANIVVFVGLHWKC